MLMVRDRLVRPVARALVLVLAVMGATVLAAGRVSAAENTAGQPISVVEVTPQMMVDSAQHLKAGVEAFTAAFAVDTSSAADALVGQVRRDVNAGRLAVHLPVGAGIDGQKVTVWRDASGSRVVHLPYAGSVVEPSGLTVAFDDKGLRQGAMEQVYQPRSATSGTVAVWVDGQLKKSVLVDASGVASEVPAPGDSPPDNAINSWWSDFTYCLGTIMAVPHWVINGLAIACAFGCFVSAGLGCILCLTGAAGAWGFAVSFCIGWASG